MSFQDTSQSIHIELSKDSTFLVADAKKADGSFNTSSIRLDDFIGNNDGAFQWGATNFTETADNIAFDMIQGGQPVLRALLSAVDGSKHAASLDLGEKIANNDGNLTFTG